MMAKYEWLAVLTDLTSKLSLIRIDTMYTSLAVELLKLLNVFHTEPMFTPFIIRGNKCKERKRDSIELVI